MMKIIVKVIGVGVVGSHVSRQFPECLLDDPMKGHFADGLACDVAFVCVPTPMSGDGSADLRYVRDAVAKANAKLIIIKSTVPPGTCRQIQTEENTPIVFSPEFYGETKHNQGVDDGFVILGGPQSATRMAARIFKEVKSADYRIMQTTWETAELVKYMDNAFLATKVTFCAEFMRVADGIGVDYNELRELWLLDPRVGRSHTFVYEDHPWYDTHCLNKDIPAIITDADRRGINMPLLAAVCRVNNNARR